MKRIVIIGLIIFLVLVVLGGLKKSRNGAIEKREPSVTETPVTPEKYQPLYFELEGKMDDFNRSITSRWDGSSYSNLIFATELLGANGNLGEGLLAKRTFDGNVLLIQRLKEMGIGGVKISITYPLLVNDFPRSQEYLAFYKKIFRELRKRNMKVIIQMTPIFSDPAISSIRVDYSGLTLESYQQKKRQQLETIISELKPDYVIVSQEPGTAAENTGLSQLRTVEGYVSTVDTVVKGLNPTGTLIGAGVGVWDKAEFITRLSQNPNLDFIDLHTYPLSNGITNYLQKMIEMTDIAKAHGKKVTVSELWLSKGSAKEIGTGGGIAMSKERFKRDAFAFWAPLDVKFIETMVSLAHYKEFEFISPFWVKYFYAYLNYSERLEALSYPQIATQSSKAAGQNIVSGNLTQTGLEYKALINK